MKYLATSRHRNRHTRKKRHAAQHVSYLLENEPQMLWWGRQMTFHNTNDDDEDDNTNDDHGSAGKLWRPLKRIERKGAKTLKGGLGYNWASEYEN